MTVGLSVMDSNYLDGNSASFENSVCEKWIQIFSLTFVKEGYEKAETEYWVTWEGMAVTAL